MRQQTKASVAPYAYVALSTFLCFLLIFFVMIREAEKLSGLGLAEGVYYIVLAVLGLSAAVVLFGVLSSRASYRGKHFGGVLNLGGPAVVCGLFMIGGFYLVPNRQTFPITAYVHGERGPGDLVLRNSGFVVLRLGPELRKEPIGDDGQAYFAAIPANFRGQEVPMWLESQGFEIVGAVQRRLVPPSIDVAVRKRGSIISGRVQDEKGYAITGAEVRISGLRTVTDNAGHFEISIPSERMKAEFELDVVAPGYLPGTYTTVPNANETVIALSRAR